jgi:hypothetical protein
VQLPCLTVLFHDERIGVDIGNGRVDSGRRGRNIGVETIFSVRTAGSGHIVVGPYIATDGSVAAPNAGTPAKPAVSHAAVIARGKMSFAFIVASSNLRGITPYCSLIF